MLHINRYKIKNLMRCNNITDAAKLATAANLPLKFVEGIFDSVDPATRDFEPLVRLGRALKVSPFDLVQSHI